MTGPLTSGFGGAPRGIRTPNRQIRSLVLCVDLVGSRRIWPAHVGWVVDLDGSRPILSDRLDDQADDQVLPRSPHAPRGLARSQKWLRDEARLRKHSEQRQPGNLSRKTLSWATNGTPSHSAVDAIQRSASCTRWLNAWPRRAHASRSST